MRTYIPKKGDFIAVTFDPQSGHEQKGRRPALVVRGGIGVVPEELIEFTYNYIKSGSHLRS